MIFDGIAEFRFRKGAPGPAIKKAFPPEGQYAPESATYSRKTVQEASLVCLFLEREDRVQGIATGPGQVLAVIGEPFASDSGITNMRRPGGKVPAADILSFLQSEPDRFIRYLKGNFQILHFNQSEDVCTIWNSKFGISPFYYARLGSVFYCSTSLGELSRLIESPLTVDGAAVLEQALFTYPLHDRSYFSEIKALRMGEKVVATAEDVKTRRYWTVTDLFKSTRLGEARALEVGLGLFKRVVNTLAADTDQLAVSMTGGFDGRANVAALDKPWEKVMCYSFGIPGSKNVTIPQRLCGRIGLRFEPVILDDGYEKVFNEYADAALFLSDALSIVERANYPYAFKRLSRWSPVVLTGIFGSELMRTFQNAGTIVSKTFVALNFAKQADRDLIARKEASRLRYLSPEYVERYLPDVLADIDAVFRESQGLTQNESFYLFVLTDALRKYFGAEVHMERLYATNRFPYLDDDFVEFIFSSPFAGVFSQPLKPTPSQRFRSQVFYAHLMKQFKPELLSATTDHGYPPAYLLRPFPLLWIGPRFLVNKYIRKWTNYREYKTEEWTEVYYKSKLPDLKRSSEIFSPRLTEDFGGSAWLDNRAEYTLAASLKIWLTRYT